MTSPENTNKPPIILLKTKSTPHDNYSDYFHQPTSDYNPTFIPVLSHNFHTERLRSIRALFTSGALLPPQSQDKDKHHARKYGGLIFTSQRAVEGFGRVLAELDDGMFSLPHHHHHKQILTHIYKQTRPLSKANNSFLLHKPPNLHRRARNPPLPDHHREQLPTAREHPRRGYREWRGISEVHSPTL